MIATMQNLRTMLSECATWQTLTGAGDATAAAAFVFLFGKEEPPDAPAAYIRMASENHRRRAAESFSRDGSLELDIEFARPEAADIEAEYVAICTTIDALLLELRQQAKTTGRLDASMIECRGPFAVHAAKNVLKFWSLELTILYPTAR